ncbi:hypothetical protein HK097_007638 [Rhizophlyctis rosea]|uniref:Uncharacterized protein n=1 Tax=Rhizophlyctis rosea TaxID=64517 RepID=A0AAD5SDB3_9FUNG|nr:hypothetical protein HK097_007638 [Rhizophlyctis rosea]
MLTVCDFEVACPERKCGGECYVLGATVLNQKPSEVAARCEIRSLPDLFNYAEEKDVQGIKDLRPYIPYNATTSKVEFDPTVTEYLYDAAYPDSSCSSDIAAVRVRPIYRTCTATLDGLDLYRIDVINSTAIVPKVCNDKDCTDCLKAEAKDERLALFNLSSTCQPRVDATTSSPLWFKSEIRTIAPASGTKPGGGGSSDGMKVDAGVMRSIVALVGVVIGLMSA